MAELRTKSGKLVSCNILNEGSNSYLVEYNGKVGHVKKGRIVSMNEEDKAVLEGFFDRVKQTFDKIKNAVKCFVFRNEKQGIIQVAVKNEDTGRVYPVSMPIQSALAAAQGKNETIVAYDGPESDYRFAEELGISISNVPKVGTENWVKEGIEKARERFKAFESVRAPRRTAINEATAREKAAKYAYVPLDMVGNKKSTKSDGENFGADDYFAENCTIEEAVNKVYMIYRKVRAGQSSKQAVCLWGAPGIGKSSMKDAILTKIRTNFPDARWVEISGRGNSDDLYMQVKTTVNFQGRSGEEREKNAVSLENIANLPMFNQNNIIDEEELADNHFYANGGRFKNGKQVSRDDGGIIFIDEFSRSKEEMMKVLMSLMSDQTVGGGMILGNRWIVIAAANTKSQMTGLDAAEDFYLDVAQSSRICNINLKPSAEEWYTKYSESYITYTSDVDGKTYTFSEVEPEILEFVLTQENKKWFYNAQIVPRDEDEYVNQFASKAIPRTWNEVSGNIRFDMILYNEENNTYITNISDFWNMKDKSGKKPGRSIIMTELKQTVGVPAAEAFTKWMDGREFTKKDAIDVWETGKCKVTTYAGPFTLDKVIVPSLISYNPGFSKISQSNSATIADLIDPEQLINVMEYLYTLITNTNKGSGAVSTIFETAFGTFQQGCIRHIKSLKNAGEEFSAFINLDELKEHPEARDLVNYFSYLGEQLEQTKDNPVLLNKIIRFCEKYEEIVNKNAKNY